MKIIDYIQGKRHGKEANRLEREALNDPFLQDAIEGFDAVPGEHLASINQLEEELKRRITRKPRVIAYRWWAIGIAASLILVLGIGSLMRMEMNIPENTALRAPKVIVPAKPDNDSIVPIHEKTEKKTIARHIQKQVIKTEIATAVVETTNNSQSESAEYSAPTPEALPPKASNNTIAFRSVDSVSLRTSTDVGNNVTIRIRGVGSITPNSGNTDTSASKSGQKEMATSPVSGKIKGKVLDENGEPLIGATVRIKGRSEGTLTDIHGNFELKIPDTGKVILETAYIGYSTKEVALTDNLNEIKLKPNELALNEVVAIGYGRRKLINFNKKTTAKLFGETEFKTYYQKHRTAGLCDTTHLIIKAHFRIDSAGKPTDITVKKAPCPEMEQEFIKCLQNSPVWTEKNHKVRLSIRF